ncbi:uncharacterized protein LY79DRAFT_648001 [Colletotrichum navitas]|uniref:NADAR domain-containing protein n=1 Tax=Colletotrichum navitas TaxID=681940 RepID=A0AAD8Q7V2_9PEZI|nr:uncharacterized protein LY79DRAFT_648001 [Colletotrichum navitas]KAK1596189.1 hypothetical protein LY79DRAFT_648001 [Colletotrichum navitas]
MAVTSSHTYRHTQNRDQVNDNSLFFFMPNQEWDVFTVSKEEISGLVSHVVDDADPHGAITFNCAEQLMMYCKVARFHDYERHARLLSTTHGQATPGFTHENWDQVKSEVVVTGKIAKSSQNPHLRRRLLSTGDRILCEAASKDRVWGIRYTVKHTMSQQRH